MDRRPVIIAIIVSLLIHYVVAETAEQFKGDPPGKRKKMVAVVQQEKKKDEPKKLPPPPPPPPPKVRATPKPAPVETPKAAPPPEPVHETHAAPVSSGLEMSNSGPGVDVGGPAGETKPKNGDGETHKPEAVKKPTAVKKPDLPAESNDLGQGPAPCTEDATKPEPIQKTDIEYTEEARASGVEGRLVLKITVDDNGAVTDVSVASSVDPSLDAAAIAAVKQWRFKPSTKCGKPVAGSYTLARRFELGD